MHKFTFKKPSHNRNECRFFPCQNNYTQEKKLKRKGVKTYSSRRFMESTRTVLRQRGRLAQLLTVKKICI